jgi:hypothetical protein
MADEKYKEMVNRRLKVALKYLDLIKAQTGNRRYEVEADDLEKIIDTLQNAIDGIQSAFDARTKAKKEYEDVL